MKTLLTLAVAIGLAASIGCNNSGTSSTTKTTTTTTPSSAK